MTRPADPRRLLIAMPTWLGDCVMATPTLRTVRGLYPGARIKALVGRNVRPVLDAMPWLDGFVTARREERTPLARRLAMGRFDAAVLLPNSFRSAMLATVARIPRRIGYERDGRGLMLTDRLIPPRRAGRFAPVPTLDYYLGIARYLGAADPDPTMKLFTRPEDDAAADALLRRGGFDPGAGRRLLLLIPGARKPGKRWSPGRFAQLADRCTDRFGVAVAVSGSPDERSILQRVVGDARAPVINLLDLGLDLRLLKSVMRRCALVVTNDTGPRHVAAAMGTPVVSLFGPTGPGWTRIDFALERQILAREEGAGEPGGRGGEGDGAANGRSMSEIRVETVVATSAELLGDRVGAGR